MFKVLIIYVRVRTSWDSNVVIATGYRLDGWGSIPGRGMRFFSPSQCSDRLWGPPSLLSNGYNRILSPGLKRPVRETDRDYFTIFSFTLSCGIHNYVATAGYLIYLFRVR
jgi:hypothetical protein